MSEKPNHSTSSPSNRGSLSEFDIYREYCALKAHFNTSYDYFKSHGRVRANPRSYAKRNDKVFFRKLTKHKNPRDYILANLLASNNWIGEIVMNAQSTENYKQWLKRKESLTYVFKSELAALDTNFNTNLLVSPGTHPIALRLYYVGKISFETLTILVELGRCWNYWDRELKDDILWQEIRHRLKKYRGFLEYDRAKFRQLLVAHFS